MVALTPLVLRPANVRDAEQIYELQVKSVMQLCAENYTPTELEAWLANYSADSYRRSLESGQDVIYVAHQEGAMAGFAAASLADRQLRGLYVDPYYARHRFGTLLLNTVESAVRGRGQHQLKVASTLTAEPFFLARDYRRIGEARYRLAGAAGTNDDEVELALIRMEKSLE